MGSIRGSPAMFAGKSYMIDFDSRTGAGALANQDNAIDQFGDAGHGHRLAAARRSAGVNFVV